MSAFILGLFQPEKFNLHLFYPFGSKGAKINTFGDHRVAMSFAVTGLVSEGVIIENAEVCSKTFKDYFTVLGRLIDNLT